MVSGYIQLFFTIFVIGVLLYIVVQFMLTVHHDLQMKAEEYSTEIIHQIAECSKLYVTNRCDPATRVQYMEQACKEWELCMERDPKEVGRYLSELRFSSASESIRQTINPTSPNLTPTPHPTPHRLKVGAETLAEILNKLVEPLSYKTMAFGTVLIFGTLLLSSTAFGMIKGRGGAPAAATTHTTFVHPHAVASPVPFGGDVYGWGGGHGGGWGVGGGWGGEGYKVRIG
ncbi:hypothetical protein HDV00_012672 [Rhizophlyctis rosea]|nr:hypothetical protein HDV00_012672 [Rhizophlyctis rosea]